MVWGGVLHVPVHALRALHVLWNWSARRGVVALQRRVGGSAWRHSVGVERTSRRGWCTFLRSVLLLESAWFGLRAAWGGWSTWIGSHGRSGRVGLGHACQLGSLV